MHGARPRSAAEGTRRRRGQGLHAPLRDHPREGQDPHRPPASGAESGHDLPGDGSRPRGRGDRLARGAGDLGQGGRGQADPFQRDHAQGGAGVDQPVRRPRPVQGQRPAGPARPRPPRGLRDQPPPVEGHSRRPVRRAGAVRRPAPDLRARCRDRRLRAPGVLVDRRPPRPRHRRRRGRLQVAPAAVQGREARDPRPGGDRPHHRGPAGIDLHRQVDQAPRAAAPGGASLHHQHPAAGGGPQAEILGETHHGRGPAALRGHRARGRDGGAHHLHAHRLGARRRRCDRGGAGRDRHALRQGVRAREAERLQDAPRRPGRSRGDPPPRWNALRRR